MMHELCIRSFQQNGHEFHLYCYSEIANVPKSVVIHDASEILPKNRIFKYKDFDSFAGFANLFRYKLLLEYGGCWVDMDMICLKPFDFKSELLAGQYQKRKNSPNLLEANCCVINVSVNSSIMRYCYEEANSKDPNALRWGETGPELVTKAANSLDMKNIIAPSEYFCPINWWEYDQIFQDSFNGNLIKKSYAVHLWAEMWRRNAFNPNDTYHKKSLFEFNR